MTVTTGQQSAREEAFRSLRSSIKFATGDTPVRTVLIVDADRKTVSDSAEQVARAFGNAGDSCVYINADFRSGSASEVGFSNLLIGSVDIEAVLEASPATASHRSIGAGTVASPDLLAGDEVAEVLAALRERFEYVILSTASLPSNSDAISLAPRVDATIVVVTSGKTRRPKAIQARDALERVGARVLGVVLIEVRRRLFW